MERGVEAVLADLKSALAKREDAVRFFHKALAVDPQDPYSAMRLKTLESSPQK